MREDEIEGVGKLLIAQMKSEQKATSVKRTTQRRKRTAAKRLRV